MQVTDEMVEAATGRLRQYDHGGHWDFAGADVREAIQAALDAMPKAAGGYVPGPAFVVDRCFPWLANAIPSQCDDDQIVLAALMKRLGDHAELTQDELHDARRRLADEEWQLISYLKSLLDPASPTVIELRSRPRTPRREDAITENGLEGPDVIDATGQSRLTANIPATPGSLGGPIGADYNPLKLITLEQIAQHLGVDQDTVDQWIQQGRAIGFPDPIQRIQAGPRFHLGAIDDWYRGYKALQSG